MLFQVVVLQKQFSVAVTSKEALQGQLLWGHFQQTL